jgi:RNA polymerase primary sigma factor
MNVDELQSFFWKSVTERPVLTREEEYEIMQAVKKGDVKAREKMILSNLRLSTKIAKDFHRKSNCNLSDLIQESNLGLIKAVDLFDPERGFKFSSYASWWMQQSVRGYILTMSSFAKQPSDSRAILWKAKDEKNKFEEQFGVSPTNEELANLIGIRPEHLKNILAISNQTTNLDAPSLKSSDGKSEPLHATIADTKSVNPDEIIDNKKIVAAIQKALSNLNQREKLVLTLRFGLLEQFKDDPRFAETSLILATGENND